MLATIRPARLDRRLDEMVEAFSSRLLQNHMRMCVIFCRRAVMRKLSVSRENCYALICVHRPAGRQKKSVHST